MPKGALRFGRADSRRGHRAGREARAAMRAGMNEGVRGAETPARDAAHSAKPIAAGERFAAEYRGGAHKTTQGVQALAASLSRQVKFYPGLIDVVI